MDNLGIHILRLKNEELLNMKETLQKIEYFLNSIP
jgi:very-short-patch-repair endonuclease